MYCARILIGSSQFPPFGFDTVKICFDSNEDISLLQTDLFSPDSHRGRSISPFAFDTVEISSNSNEDISFLQKDLLCPDSYRERSVSPLRVRYNRDKL